MTALTERVEIPQPKQPHLTEFRSLLAACQTETEVNQLMLTRAPGIGVLTRRRKSVLNAVDRRLDEINPRRKPKVYEPYDD